MPYSSVRYPYRPSDIRKDAAHALDWLKIKNGGVYAYDGGDNPEDVRHQAAKCAEKMYLRMMEKKS